MGVDERCRLSAGMIRAEIERQMGRRVEFVAERCYLYETDQWVTDVRFSAQGYGVSVRLADSARGMALEEFGTRIVAPMVHRWRTAVEGKE